MTSAGATAAPDGVASVPAAGLVRLRELASESAFEPAWDMFYFLRHGQTARNLQKIFQGPEEPLSARGIGQAQVAAALLAEHRLASIICSDMPRAIMTARIVLQAQSGLPTPKLREQASLRERNFGALIGTSSRGLDWDCAPDNGETLEQFIDRTRRALIAALSDPTPVLVVAHGGTLHVLAALLRVSTDDGLLANARPMRFFRPLNGPRSWSVEPLGEVADPDSTQIS
ncbi:MAG: histidine phosphatase family protein [Burkholderiales bacterium]